MTTREAFQWIEQVEANVFHNEDETPENAWVAVVRAPANVIGATDHVILASDLCRRRHLQAEGGPGLVHLVTGFRELAEAEGVPTEVLDQCMITNAATVLTMV